MFAIPIDQQRSLERYAKKNAKQLLAQISNVAKQPNRTFVCRSLMDHYFRNDCAHLYAAARARDKCGISRTITSSDIARCMKAPQFIEENVGLSFKTKKSGVTRVLCQFGPLRTAAQYLALDYLKATRPLPEWRYEAKGRGPTRAISDIISSIEDGSHFYCCLDISNCFESFEGDRVCKLLPLPKEVTRHVIMADDLVMANCYTTNYGNIRYHTNHVPQPKVTGLPQGSVASNYAAGVLLSDLAGCLPASSRIFMFVDDLLVLASTRQEADENANRLREYLIRHPAGRLGLKREEVGDLRLTPCDFVGYSISVKNGMPYAQPTTENMLKLEGHFWSAFAVDRLNNDYLLTATRRKLESWFRNFSHWPDGQAEFEARMQNARFLMEHSGVLGDDAE